MLVAIDSPLPYGIPLFLPPWRSVVRSPRLFHEAFVRSIMNSVSFVEGGSFLLAPSKLRSLHRRREGSEERKGHGDQGGAIYELTLPL